MLVVSACPLRVASLLWQPQPSAWTLTVVCRATILLQPGESSLAEHHEDPAEVDEYWDDDPGRSLRAASDLVPTKARADVTLVGHAFAPEGKPVRSIVARLLVGELSKSIEVVADRWADQDGVLHDGAPFTRMPIVYERASGGTGTANPAGASGTPNRYGRISLPNLQPPGVLVTSLDDYIAPVGFGPIAPAWPSRRERLGRAAVSGTPPDLSRPLPDDLDPQYWNHAPRDQQVQLLRDRERLILENLHPDHARFVTDLPSVRPRAVVERQGRSHPVPLRCDTLWIDTDRALCTLTWRAQVPLKRPDEPGRVVFSLDNPGSTGSRAAAKIERLQLRPLDPETDTLVPNTDRGAATPPPDKVLPFNATPPPLPRPPEDKPTGVGLPFVTPPSRVSVPAPAPSAPYTMSPPAVPPPPVPVPPPLPPPRASQPADDFDGGATVAGLTASVPPTAGVLSQGGYPPVPPPLPPPSPPRPSLWSVPDAGPGGPALTVGQLAAVPAKPVISAPVIPPPPPIPPPRPSAPSAAAPPAPALADPPEPPRKPAPDAEPRMSTRAPPASAPAAAQAAAPAADAKPEGKKALQLVYFEPEGLPRIRKKKVFQPLLAALEDRPLDPDLDDPALSKDPVAIEDRRDVFEVLARGEVTDETALEDALDRAVRDDGKFVAPFLLLAGELRLAFDDLSALRATISLATPFASGDEGLKLAIGDARDLLATPDLLSPAGLAERFAARIVDAFRKARRQVAPGYLEEQVERALLEKRLYQRREVFGASHLRALLTVANPNAANPNRPWPVYLPESTWKKLPMFARFSARVLVEAHLQEDQFETHPNALRALAMARVVTVASKGDKPAADVRGSAGTSPASPRAPAKPG